MSPAYFNKKQHEKKKHQGKTTNLPLIFSNNKFENKTFIALISSAAVVLIIGIIYIYGLFSKYGIFGFPLDDPFIHLTFARNLIEYGSFSYFRTEIVTSGSTSPVYTLLLAVIMIISKNEYIISYFLGLAFGILSVIYFFRLLRIQFNNSALLVIALTFLFSIQPKFNLMTVSGMETTMFIFLILTSFYYYRNFNKYLLGASLGLLIWCRPDGIIVWIAVFLDFLIRKFIIKNYQEEKPLTKEMILAAVTGLIIVAGYFLFNYSLSGSFWPNTLQAKSEYYRLNQRSYFLKEEVYKFLVADEMIIFIIPFIIGAFLSAYNIIVKRNYDVFFIYPAFVIGLILAYYIEIPFSHRFNRYLIPVIPALYIGAVYGLKQILELISKNKQAGFVSGINGFIVIIFLITAGLSVNGLIKNFDEFRDICKYHEDRHIAAGKWIDKNTPKEAIIGTHDIGAIGFYGNRKIIDIAGLITPELIKFINDKNYSNIIDDYIYRNKVTHLALLRNWFEVVNDNPLFTPTKEPEIMEIYQYKKGVTHFLSREVSMLTEQGAMLIQRQEFPTAINYLNEAIRLDQKNSKAYLLLGAAYINMNDVNKSELNFRRALEIFPEYPEAYFGLAQLSLEKNNKEEAKNYVALCLKFKPDFEPARELMTSLNN